MTTKDLKQAIKDLAQKQRETKEQRKSVRFTGKRSLTPRQAQLLALEQKELLKHMYIAYALLRNKPIEKTISEKTTYSKRRVDEIMAKYAEAVCVGENGS